MMRKSAMKYEARVILMVDRYRYILQKALREHMRGMAEKAAERNMLDTEPAGPLVEEELTIVLGAGFFPEARVVYAKPSEENKYGKKLKIRKAILIPNMSSKREEYTEMAVCEEWIDMPQDHIVVDKEVAHEQARDKLQNM